MTDPPPSPGTALRLTITGCVQGVGYRAALYEAALRLGLSGWVRNRADGSVEAVVHGPPKDVERLAQWATRGPPAARVQCVERSSAEPPAQRGFEIRPTV